MIAVLAMPLPFFAQTTKDRSWRKLDDPWTHKNSITVSSSVISFSGYNGMGLFNFHIEYDRVLPNDVSVSAIGLFAPMQGDAATDTPTMREHFWFAGAKINYNLPVVRNWLWFRIGMGGGVGIHNVPYDFAEGIIGRPVPPVDRFIKPHLMVDMYWIFRVSRRMDLRFAPLLISPSQFVFGGRSDDPFDTPFYYWNPMGTLGASVRF